MANGAQPVVKISGYLEKKAKLRIGSPWKKYWFVLEGRLLLYYRSKDEYETLSPCKGSINLCPPCNIKPALSAAGVFQIECRASTVTLRAENRSEQERWMQALLAAIAQSKTNSNRMSHFRYSLDDLPTPIKDNSKTNSALARQNTMPYRISSSPKKEMIQRLQHLGAQTYGGSLETITKLACKEQDLKIVSQDLIQNSDKIHVLLNDNEHYSIIQEENSMELLQVQEPERKTTSIIVDNDQYIGSIDKKEEKEKKISFLVENDQYCNSEEDKSEIVRTKETLGVEHIYERISSESNTSQSKDVELQYSVVQKKQKPVENEYSVPINVKNEDHNKNSIVIDNEQYVTAVDDQTNNNHYSDNLLFTPEYIEYDAIDKIKEQEDLYEDPDTLKTYTEPVLPPRPESKKQESSEETSSQTSSNDDKNKKKRSRFKLLKQFITSDKKLETNTPKPKLKNRSSSFMRRVWRRKAKSLDADEDSTYETVDYEYMEKQIKKDHTDLEMLKELQKILEERKTLLQEKLNANEKKVVSKMQSSETISQPIAEEREEDILEFRTGLPSTSKLFRQTVPLVQVEEQKPDLPPRQSLKFTAQVLPPIPVEEKSSPDSSEKVKTIDEILEDLDKEKQSKKNVKQLIEKFNDIQNDDEVMLRKKPCKFYLSLNRESDDLTKLLEELSKVTSAPVLTPGVTSSLVTPILSDEEWLQLIPIRRRRLSDPDYDVPRPHRSLQLQDRDKPNSENAIPATRFFGPILQSSDTKMAIHDSQSILSMDPDSLELLPTQPVEYPSPFPLQIISATSTIEKNLEIDSYTSHHYLKDDKVVYALPKAIIMNRKSQNQEESIYKNFHPQNHEDEDKNKNSKSDEIFVDSLEPLAEISTAF